MHSSDCAPVAEVMEGSDYGEQMVCSGDIFVRCVAEKNTAETLQVSLPSKPAADGGARISRALNAQLNDAS